MIHIPKGARVGIDSRGGPHNGPFAAGVLQTLLPGLHDLGVQVSNLYANSATVPGTALAAVGGASQACEMWGSLTPTDVVHSTRDWKGRARTFFRLLQSEAILDGTPLERLVRGGCGRQPLVSLDDMFGPDATPFKFMAADYLTGKPVIFNNRNPKHRTPNFYSGQLGSMALTPFLKCQIVYDVVEEELLAEPYTRGGALRDIAVLFDGGFIANLMLEVACRDDVDVLFVVDINGLELPPLETHKWDHWTTTHQRAFSVVITTNDHRHLMGLERVNEAIRLHHEVRAIADSSGTRTKAKLMQILERADRGLLDLAGKHRIDIVKVEDREQARPFDFSNFRFHETQHLMHSGHQAAKRVLDQVKVV